MKYLQNHIEALIFCTTEPISSQEIRNCLEEMLAAPLPKEDIQEALKALIKKYRQEDYSFQIEEIAGGYQFMTKPKYHPSVSLLLKQKSKKKLSKSALETLAIIAYKQPITKGEIENIRGVSSDYAVQKLLEKELLSIKGKADSPGRPILYGTSGKFMEHFGLQNLDELPQLKDFGEEEKEMEDTSSENSEENR